MANIEETEKARKAIKTELKKKSWQTYGAMEETANRLNKQLCIATLNFDQSYPNLSFCPLTTQ